MPNTLPKLSPGSRHLPWALARVRENVAVQPGGGDRGHGSACARGAAIGTSHGAGINATAGNRNACGRSASGRRRDGRLSIARPLRQRPDTPRLRKRAASESGPRPRPLRILSLHRRVVTQQKLFFPPLCDRPGCHEHPTTSLRNPARYCCTACRQAVRRVLDRERKWLSRGTLDGRKKRSYEYQASRRNRPARLCCPSAPAPSRPPPG